MFRILVAVYIILLIALIICTKIISKGNINSRKSMFRLFCVGIFTVASYIAFILTPVSHPYLAAFIAGIFYLSTDWLMISLLFFVEDYTQIQPFTKYTKMIPFILAGADSVSLVANTFTRHLFDLEIGTLFGETCWQMQFTPLYYVSILFGFLIVIYSVILLVRRLAVAPRIYKSKYGTVLGFIMTVILLNLLCTILGTKFDYSVLSYGLLAISICYFVLYASPKRLMEDMHSKLMEDSVIGLVVYDEDKNCVGMNQTAKELFNSESEIYSAAEQYLVKWEEEHQGNMRNVMGAEQVISQKDQTRYLYVNYQQLKDERGRILGSSFQFEDRTEVVEQYEEEKYKITHDMLTGLLNRDAFEDEVKRILSKADKPYYMICTNIKDFKLINELCGMDVGDSLLRAQADLIRSEEHGITASARVYADKFCTLLPKSHYDEVRFEENMRALLDGMESIPLKMHFYFGIYEIVDIDEPVWTMCDKAMMAIESIRGNYERVFCFYKEELFQRIMREKEIIGDFDKALDDQEFHMFLQPQIANDGTVIGAEALVRWIHPDKGMISPADFIPVLEKTGLIHRLDIYMWEKAAQKLQEWKEAGKENISISVNISTQDFYLINICDTFRTISEKYDFDIKNLKLEITESALMKDIGIVMRSMDELHALGFDIEIDDFGSGYSSLGMLKDIRADILKIDMIFLQKTENVERSTTILKNVISMSKELGMPVITEGVETKEQVDFLQDVGCDMFQGFYFARPMSVDNFEQAYSM